MTLTHTVWNLKRPCDRCLFCWARKYFNGKWKNVSPYILPLLCHLHRNNPSLAPLLPPGLIRVRDHRLLPPPHGCGEVWPVVGDETPEEDGGARLVVLLLHRVALVVHRGQPGDDDDEVDQQGGGRMCVDLAIQRSDEWPVSSLISNRRNIMLMWANLWPDTDSSRGLSPGPTVWRGPSCSGRAPGSPPAGCPDWRPAGWSSASSPPLRGVAARRPEQTSESQWQSLAGI